MNAKDRIMSPLAGGSASTVPRRILHVVPGLERGGIEMWLMNVLRSIDAVRYPMDFGVVLRLAARHQVPIRIAHSHNNTRPAEARASWPRRSYLALMKRWIQRYATHRLAVSRSAADDLFGHRWASDPLAALITWGLDLTPWALRHDRTLLGSSLGLPEDALVLGHVGWFQWREARPGTGHCARSHGGGRGVVRSNRIGIDTGACWTGCLTCLVLEEREFRFLTTGGKAYAGRLRSRGIR